MSGERRLDAEGARLNVAEARRLVAEACQVICQHVEAKIREASRAGLTRLNEPFDGLTVRATSEMREMVREEFKRRGFAWEHRSDQRDGDYDGVSW
jgi:hypothetical protein